MFNSCKKSGETIVDSQVYTNLITNSSFESSGNASVQDWKIAWTSSGLLQSAQDAPAGGGSWSVSIHNANFPAYSAAGDMSFTAAALAGAHIYKFSFWGKYNHAAGPLICQRGELWLHHDNIISWRKSIVINNTAWTLYDVLDTLSANEGDSLIVALEGSHYGPSSATTFFDLCKLEILN
jgi:hypothetical protein